MIDFPAAFIVDEYPCSVLNRAKFELTTHRDSAR